VVDENAILIAKNVEPNAEVELNVFAES